MTLQEILLSLSKNKDYYVECFCTNGYMSITVKEYWYHRPEVTVSVNLETEITEEEIRKLTPYLTE